MNAFISNILRYFPRVRESSGGGSRGGARPHPLIFRPKWGPKSRKKFLGDGPSPISGSGWPLSPPLHPVIWRSGSATVQDSLGFWTPRQILYSRYWIPVFVSGTWILDSNRLWDSGFLWVVLIFRIPKPRVPDSKTFSDFGFHKQKFSGFRNSDSVT